MCSGARARILIIGTLVLRPIEGEDIAIELCPGYAAGQAAQEELRLRIGEVVGDAEESQEIFDSASFVLPDLIEDSLHTLTTRGVSASD